MAGRCLRRPSRQCMREQVSNKEVELSTHLKYDPPNPNISQAPLFLDKSLYIGFESSFWHEIAHRRTRPPPPTHPSRNAHAHTQPRQHDHMRAHTFVRFANTLAYRSMRLQHSLTRTFYYSRHFLLPATHVFTHRPKAMKFRDTQASRFSNPPVWPLQRLRPPMTTGPSPRIAAPKSDPQRRPLRAAYPYCAAYTNTSSASLSPPSST